MPGRIAGWVHVPVADIDWPDVKKELTLQRKKRADETEKPKPILAFRPPRRGIVGLPIDYALTRWPDMELVDDTSTGGDLSAPRRADPYHESAPAGQDEFLAKVVDQANQYYTIMVVAPTGSGKTVVGLQSAIDLGRSTLVMVHRKKILDQWRERANEIFGIQDDDIGYISGHKMQLDKPLVLALYQTIVRRPEAEIRDAFGTVIWDEVHTVPVPSLEGTLGKFSAAHKIALTATLTRKDKMDKILRLYFGEPRVSFDAKMVPLEYNVIPYISKGKIWGKTASQKMMCLARDKARTEWLAAHVYSLYRDGRQVLAIGERIDIIEAVAAAVQRRMDVGEHDVGFFTGSITENGTRQTVSDEYLEWVKKHPRIVFATYGMMTAGIDMPRLDAGIELTPRADIQQTIGRIRRLITGKPEASWFSPLDIRMGLCHGLLKSRLKELSSVEGVRVRSDV